MHWEWKNCPFARQGQYSGHAEGCTIFIEAVASHDLLILHYFFGMACSHDDINVQRSPVFYRLAEGNALVLQYDISCYLYNKCYYLLSGGIHHTKRSLGRLL
jgi:hypothetical protein